MSPSKRLLECKNGQHELEVIYRHYTRIDFVEEVVRWCRFCGAVVVDGDCDGRTNPGEIMPMKRPDYLLVSSLKQE